MSRPDTPGPGVPEHVADQRWDCRVCQLPWPCPTAQEQLVGELSPTRLAAHMYGQLELAAGALPDVPVGVMFDRFIRWTWREHPASSS